MLYVSTMYMDDVSATCVYAQAFVREQSNHCRACTAVFASVARNYVLYFLVLIYGTYPLANKI